MEDGRIEERQLNCSSKWDEITSVGDARLNKVPQGDTYGAWIAGVEHQVQGAWIQVTLICFMSGSVYSGG